MCVGMGRRNRVVCEKERERCVCVCVLEKRLGLVGNILSTVPAVAKAVMF